MPLLLDVARASMHSLDHRHSKMGGNPNANLGRHLSLFVLHALPDRAGVSEVRCMRSLPSTEGVRTFSAPGYKSSLHVGVRPSPTSAILPQVLRGSTLAEGDGGA